MPDMYQIPEPERFTKTETFNGVEKAKTVTPKVPV